MTWRVICDFDGTISTKDTTDQLLERFADPAWHAIEAEWISGTIGSAECMRQQVELVRASKQELDLFLSQIEIDPSFIDFVWFCERQRIDISIASDGIDYIIRSVLARYGLDHLRVTANRLSFLGGNRYTLNPYVTSGVCKSGTGVCKCCLAEVVRTTDKRILYVGDGRSDFCVSQHVDLVLAKSNLLTFCQQHELPHAAFLSFRDVEAVLRNLAPPRAMTAFLPAQPAMGAL
jgi:2-hydroxy-3-keto-5-methylthiopentenyl-1-phosphate phosphatase